MIKLVTSLLILLALNHAFGQFNTAGIPLYSNFQAKTYNANPQNLAVVQDSAGLIYVGNVDGILQYDGLNWRKFELNNSSVFALALGSDNKVYFGALGLFGVLEPTKNGDLEPKILSSMLDTTFAPVTRIQKVYSMGNNVYFSNYSTLIKYNVTNKTFSEQKLPRYTFFTFKVEDKIFGGNYLQGLIKVLPDTFELVKNGQFFASKNIYSILSKKSGELIVVTGSDGLFKYNLSTGEITKLGNAQTQSLLSEVMIYDACFINQNLTLATLNSGLILLDSNFNTSHHLSKEVGVKDDIVTSVYSNKDQRVLWTPLNIGISAIEIQSPVNVFAEESALIGGINSIARFNGQLYVATDNGVFRQINDVNKKPLFKRLETIDAQTFSLTVYNNFKGDSCLLAGTIQGVYEIYHANRISLLESNLVGLEKFIENSNIEESQKRFYVYALGYNQKTKTLWLADDSDLIALKKEAGAWRIYYSYKVENEIRHITFDNDQRIWIATSLNGLFSFTESNNSYSCKPYNTELGLPTDFGLKTYFFNNKLRVTTPKGVYCFNSNSNRFEPDTTFPKVFYDGSTSIVSLASIGHSEFIINYDLKGKRNFDIVSLIPSVNNNKQAYIKRLGSENCESYYFDNNLIWLGISNKLYSFNLQHPFDSLPKFNCTVRKVEGRDSVYFMGTFYDAKTNELTYSQPKSQQPVISYNQNDLTFHFSALFYEGIEATEYSYSLGDDEGWSKWSKEPKAVFTNFYEGHYTFMVKARNIYGTESTISSYAFDVLPPWYRTVLAYILYVLFILLSVWVTIKLYTRNLKLEKIRLEGIVVERTAEIRLQRDQISAQKESIEDSILYARRIQRAILPSDEMARELIPDHFILFRPRDIVSGDYYWINRVGSKTIVVAADCTGHGVPGAFMSMLGLSFLNEIVLKENVHQAHEILNGLRRRVKQTLKQEGKEGEAKDGMDVALVVIDSDARKLYYAGAYNPMYVFRGTELIEFKADRMPIGIYISEKDSFTLNTFDYLPDDTFYIFSDGYADQFGGEKGHKFQSKNMKAFLASIQNKSMAEQKEALNQNIIDWMGEKNPQIDDQVIIGVRLG